MRGKHSVRRGIWYIGEGGGGRDDILKNKQRGGAIPFGLTASAAAPFLGEVARHLLKKSFGGRRRRRRR